MKIKLIHKTSKNRVTKSFIKSGDMGRYCTIELNYQNHPEILEDIKKTLSKYYDFKIENQNIKKATGSVTRAFCLSKKYKPVKKNKLSQNEDKNY